jgi:two-component system, LytTR family, response regulator
MIPVIIVDDEPLAQKHMQSLVRRYCSQLDIKAIAASVDEALEQILLHQPGLVFLDIELAGQNSFELLQQIRNRQFEVIFVTAHAEFGIQALKQDAADYILKPVNKMDLINAVDTALERLNKRKVLRHREAAPAAGNSVQERQRIALPTLEGLQLIQVQQIMYCAAEGRYTHFYMSGNPKGILVSRNLGEYEAVLPQGNFVRIHHHYIVNINFVERYVKGRGGYVVMQNGKALEVSSRKKDAFFERLGNVSE